MDRKLDPLTGFNWFRTVHEDVKIGQNATNWLFI